MADLTVSGSDNPYQGGTYTATANEKNTLSMTSYFQLLAAQMQNQDMTNPMDNSELMAQLTQMAMVQSMDTMNDAIELSSAITTSTYAAGLVGQELTIAVTEKNAYGMDVPVGVKYGKVEAVDLTGSSPAVKIEGDDEYYPMSYILGVGKLDDPYNTDDEEKDETGSGSAGEDGTETQKNALFGNGLTV